MAYSARAPWSYGATPVGDARRERPVWTREEFLARARGRRRAAFACPRCTLELREPWRRVLIGRYLRARVAEDQGSATSSEALAPKVLRFDCPECALPIVELRSGARSRGAMLP